MRSSEDVSDVLEGKEAHPPKVSIMKRRMIFRLILGITRSNSIYGRAGIRLPLEIACGNPNYEDYGSSHN